MTDVRHPSLTAIRDLLLPGLYAHGGRAGIPVELDMSINFATNSIVVKGYCAATKRSNQFVITHSSLCDQSYKRDFNKNVSDLVDYLKYGPVPHGAVI